MHFASLTVYLETDVSYFVDLSTKRYVGYLTAIMKRLLPRWTTSRFFSSKRVKCLHLLESLWLERERELELGDSKMGIFRLLSAFKNDGEGRRCVLRLSRDFEQVSRCRWSFRSARLQRERLALDSFQTSDQRMQRGNYRVVPWSFLTLSALIWAHPQSC